MALIKEASHVKLRVEPLNRPEGWEIFNLPKRIKTASFEKSKETDMGGFDLTSEIKKHPDNLYIKIFAIKENEPNDNADSFSPEELKKAASTFIGVPLFTNHQNDDVEKSRGECIHAWYDKEAGGIYIIGRVDKIAYPKLARGIEENYISGTSMGCSVEYSVCSICHNKAHTAEEYCTHIKEAKNRKRSGKYDCRYHDSDCHPEDDCPVCGCKKGEKKALEHNDEKVFEWNYGLKFIENSFVVNPACHSCGVTCILHAPEVTKKVAQIKEALSALQYEFDKNPQMFRKAAEAGLLERPTKTASAGDVTKIAGQIELDLLKQSMENCEKVIRSMLAQKDHIDVDYISEIIKAMGQIQDTVDELTEMGYPQLQSPPEAMSQKTGDVTFPPPVAGQVQQPIQATQVQPSNNPVASSPKPSSGGGRQELPGGIGSITMPKRSSIIKKKKEFAKTSANVMRRLASLRDTLTTLKRAYRSNNVADFILDVWEDAKNTDSHHVMIDKEFVTIAKGDNVIKTASISEFPENFRSLIESDPKKAAQTYLESYLAKESEEDMADKLNKTAQVGSRPEGKPQQQEVITEKQFEKNPPKYHPRTGESYEQITESDEQLGRSDDKVNNTTSTSPQRRLGTYETTTEDQLDKVSEGYIIRAKDTPDVITEKQWDDFSRTVSAKLPGDWLETITQDQIRKLLSNHTFVGTYETITEDQLKNQDLGIKRWANAGYVKALTKVAFEALSDVIAKFKKSPDEIKRVIASLTDDPKKMARASFCAVCNSLPFKNDERKNILANAEYFGKLAGVSLNGVDTLDALTIAIAENAKAGLKADDVFETIGFSLRRKEAMAKVEKMVQVKLANKTDESHVDKFAALSDAISSLDGYDLRTTVNEIGADPKNKKAFVAAAYKYAKAQTGEKNIKISSIKVAQDAGLVRILIDALEDVAAKLDGGAGAAGEIGGEIGGDIGGGLDGESCGDLPNGDLEIEFVGNENDLDGTDDTGVGEELEDIDSALDGPGGTEEPEKIDDFAKDHQEEKDLTANPAVATGDPAAVPAADPAAKINAPVVASKRAAARENTIKQAQMMGGEMGGQGGAAQGPGAGASLPQPPDMQQQPVESFGADSDAAGGEEGAEGAEGDNKAMPPGSICTVCGSKDVDIINGKGKCNNCASEFTYKVTVEVTKWSDLLGDSEQEGKEEEGDEFGGEGFEMPQEGAAAGAPAGAGAPAPAAGGGMPEVPVAAMTRLKPEALRKLAEAKIEVGSVSPFTGSTNTKKLANGEWLCMDSGRCYRVAFAFEKSASSDAPKTVYAQWEWTPTVPQNVCPSCNRARKQLVKALSLAGVTEAQFDAMTNPQRAKLLVKLKNAGSFKQIKTAAKSGSVIADYKKAFAIEASAFPIESCREKLARRYGKNALALSGPCEGQPLYDCVCNSLKSAGIYSDKIANKVAYAWSDVDGSEECIEDLVRLKMTIREAAMACSVLKTALADDEDFLADDLGNKDGDNGPEDDGPDDGDKGGAPIDIDESGEDEVDPFDGGVDGEEEGIEDPAAAKDGLPAAGTTVTVELPAEVVQQLDAQLDKALGENPAEEAHHEPLPGAPGIENPAAPAVPGSEAPAVPGGDATGLSSEPVGGEVQEVGGPAELGLDKPCGPGMNAGGPSKPLTANPQQNVDQKEGVPGEPVVNNNLKQGNPGIGAMAQSENDLKVQAELDAAAFMKSRVGGVGKAAGLDYSALAAKLGIKQAGEKEIEHERVQDSKDIGQFSAGKPASGKTVGQIGHEKETIRDAELPSVPRADALMGHESETISKDNPLPKIPSDKGTLGHESEVGLSGGDVRFTGGTSGGGQGGSAGAGSSELKAKAAGGDEEIVTAEAEAELRAMRGVIGNSRDRMDMLIQRLAGKLKDSKPVADDGDTKPYSGTGAIGHEKDFTAEEPKNTEGSGNEAQMGHEGETLGDTPKTAKDKPEIPGDNSGNKALMGHEGDNDLNPEKKLENKGTVIASGNVESKAEAFRVAGLLLENGIIKAAELQTKVDQLAQYQPAQIRDYEKAVFANANSKKRGLTTASEGLERPLIINEAASLRKKTASKVDSILVEKLQSMLSLDKKNKLAEETPDFNLKNVYRR